MKNEDVKKVILHLDDDSPFLTEIRRRFFPRQKSLSTADRLVYPMGDPAFGIHFVRAYHRTDAWLPREIWCPSIWRGFCCLQYDSELRGEDDDCFEALALGHPANRPKQALIKGLLCSRLSYKEVGERCGIASDVIEVYAHLFFDFAERRDNHSFVMKVLNPHSQLTVLNTDKSKTLDPVLLAMRIGYCLGAKAVVKALGLSDEWNSPGQEEQPVNNIKNALLSTGEMKARLGLLAAGDLEFTLAKTLLAEEAKHHPDALDDDWKMGLGALSFDEGAQKVMNGIMLAAAKKRLISQQEFDVEAAREEIKKKPVAGGSGLAGGANGQAAT